MPSTTASHQPILIVTGTQVPKQHKHKRKEDKKKKDHQSQTTMVHISQLGSTTAIDPTKLKDGESGQLLESLAIKEKTRSQNKLRELDENQKEQVEFLNKCRNLVQSMIPGPTEVNTDKPLEKAYQLFESMCQRYRHKGRIPKRSKKNKQFDC